jgi:hypothetical protein
MIRYWILSSSTAYKLAEEVEKWLEEGWQLVGGVSSHSEGVITTVYCQAIMKQVEE